jgi:hypothetical protein
MLSLSQYNNEGCRKKSIFSKCHTQQCVILSTLPESQNLITIGFSDFHYQKGHFSDAQPSQEHSLSSLLTSSSGTDTTLNKRTSGVVLMVMNVLMYMKG